MHIATSGIVVSLLLAPCAAQVAGSYRQALAGCPDASLLYEQFAPGTFDLGGQIALDWFPNGQLGYVVLHASRSILPFAAGQVVALANEAVSAPLNLGFTLPYPTGMRSTTQIEVSSNGYIYLEPGTISSARCCEGTGQVFRAFREDTPSWAILGMDLDPSAGGNVWFTTSAGRAWVTWDQVPEIGQTQGNTVQIVFEPTGQVTMIWGNASTRALTALVGWSGGGGVEDNGPFDFSASSVYNMGSSSGPLTIGAPPARLPTLGRTFSIDVRNVTADAVSGAMLFGNATANIGLDPFGMPGCSLLVGAQIGAFPMALTPPTGTFSLFIPNNPFFTGFGLETQAVVIAPSVNTLGIATSNRGTMKIGDYDPVIVRAAGPDNENDDESSGFWSVTNATSLSITALRFDWVRSSVPNTNYFDTNQIGMKDRFDGGNSRTPLCTGTYRNGSDVVAGLDYGSSILTPCGGGTRTGFVGSNFGSSPGDYRTLDFNFVGFDPGDVFEFDADTDGGPGNGGAMAGLVVTVWMSDGSMRKSELVMIDLNTSEASL